jgi:Arc/MetJ-type ribon-helix-helix transcriptional regulator
MPVETERVTLRLPVNDLALIDAFVDAGEFMNRSDVIRAAIRDYVRSRAKVVSEGVEARKAVFASADEARKLEELRASIEELQRLVKK